MTERPLMVARTARRLREGAFLLTTPIALYLAVCLASYDAGDPGWTHQGDRSEIGNVGGFWGAWIADIGLLLFGFGAYLIPLMIAWYGVVLLREAKRETIIEPLDWWVRIAGLMIAVIGGVGLAHLHFVAAPGALPNGSGGVLGQAVGDGLSGQFGPLGSSLFLLALFLAGVTWFTGLSWLGLMDSIGRAVLRFGQWLLDARERLADWRIGRKARAERTVARKVDSEKRRERPAPVMRAAKKKPEKTSDRAKSEAQLALFDSIPEGELPPLKLLQTPPERKSGYSKETLEALSRQVELKLADFRIEAKVVEVQPGPVITRFELELAPGVKGTQVSNLAKDLARGLAVNSVRVVEVIPGRPTIGLEIPNSDREIVYLSEILRTSLYDRSKSPLTIALGKDIGGNPVVVDIAKMPHLLVAGTTGSGKSVAVNAMVISVLYKATPEQVKLILIDPKMLELSVYEGIPHLLTPVVTDMKDAANALRWCVAEMERRYQLMAAVGVRNLAGFNRKVREAAKSDEPLYDPLFNPDHNPGGHPEPLAELPLIVVVIDEFADMMMIVGKKVEELIARLAQKARASGIHLLLATQRPSVDVITGLIKANVPTRIAFQVSSKVDSRTILDQMGAEQLLGHGDMLYLPPGKSQPERVHGAFVDDPEVHAVTQYLTRHGEPRYLEDVVAEAQAVDADTVIGDTGLPEAADGEQDELYDQAVAEVIKSRRASISHVQRRLKVGYNRAARMIEEMETAGVVSAPAHNGTREVLVPDRDKE